MVIVNTAFKFQCYLKEDSSASCDDLMVAMGAARGAALESTTSWDSSATFPYSA